MNKTEYSKFVGTIQDMIFTFVNDYGVKSACKLPQHTNDDIQWTLNLGEVFGSINIIIESWERASYKGKVNVCSIPMMFHTYRDTEKLFLMRSGSVNTINGKFVLHIRSNAVETLVNDFKSILEIWSYSLHKKVSVDAVCMN